MKHENTRVLSAGTLKGDKVRNLQGEDIGKIDDIMLDIGSGRVAYAVLSFGGVMGLGDKLFAIPWQALSLDKENKQMILDVEKEKLKNAPGFDKGDWPDFTPDLDEQIYGYYGYSPYWREGRAA
jgi:sporulation protein YlmC with PRC-barrel domain